MSGCSRTEPGRAGGSGAESRGARDSRAGDSRAESHGARDSRAGDSRAEDSRAGDSGAESNNAGSSRKNRKTERHGAESRRSAKRFRHVFSVAVYGESPYLEELICSLKRQSLPSGIILCTAAPSRFLTELSARYSIPVCVRNGKPGIREDWNFAYEEGAKLSELVTIAHQDDLYYPSYTKALLHAYRHYPDMSVFCCRYDTIDEKGRRVPGQTERVKRLLRLRLRNHKKADRTEVKLSALRFGNGIGCPTCTYNVSLCGSPLCRNDYQFILDWDTLIRLAKSPGRFLCVEKPLMAYRVHGDAETARQIRNHNREKEEAEEFEKLHGRFLSRLLMRFYRRAYHAYEAGAGK